MRELILLEEFKNCIPERTVVYLNEQKVSTLQQAAILAEEFTLTHKTLFMKHNLRQNPPKSNYQVRNNNWSGPPRQDKQDRPRFFCHKTGHLIAECEAWKQKQQRSVPQQPKGVGLIDVSPRASTEGLASEVPDSFKPFSFDGYVSITGKAEDQRPVKILRDTACSQSLVLSRVLPLRLT